MNKTTTAVISTFVPLLTLVAYCLYIFLISGQHYQSINLLEDSKIRIGNFSFSSKAPQSESRIPPIALTPSGNPYRLNLTVGYSQKTGKPGVTKYSHELFLKDPHGKVVFTSNKSHQKKDKTGGRTKVTLQSEALGVIDVAEAGEYLVELEVKPGATEIHSIRLDIRKNVAKVNPIILTLLILAIIPGFIMFIRLTKKQPN